MKTSGDYFNHNTPSRRRTQSQSLFPGVLVITTPSKTGTPDQTRQRRRAWRLGLDVVDSNLKTPWVRIQDKAARTVIQHDRLRSTV